MFNEVKLGLSDYEEEAEDEFMEEEEGEDELFESAPQAKWLFTVYKFCEIKNSMPFIYDRFILTNFRIYCA